MKHGRDAATGNRKAYKGGSGHSKLGRDPMGRSQPGKVKNEGGADMGYNGATGGHREGDARGNKPSSAGTKIP